MLLQQIIQLIIWLPRYLLVCLDFQKDTGLTTINLGALLWRNEWKKLQTFRAGRVLLVLGRLTSITRKPRKKRNKNLFNRNLPEYSLGKGWATLTWSLSKFGTVFSTKKYDETHRLIYTQKNYHGTWKWGPPWKKRFLLGKPHFQVTWLHVSFGCVISKPTNTKHQISKCRNHSQPCRLDQCKKKRSQ